MRRLASSCVVVLAFAGCASSESSPPGGGSGTPPDVPPFQVASFPVPGPAPAPTPTPPRGALGGPCATNSDCDSSPGANDGVCYVGAMGVSVFAPEGYCTRDNGQGTVCATDADCGAGGQCADSSGYRICVPACGAGGACPIDQACFAELNGFALDRPACVPGNAGARDGDACLGFYQCNTYSDCRNSAEHPGGQCETYGCTVGDDATCHGGTCHAIADYPTSGNLCEPSCQTDADCRASEGYRCYDPGDGSASYCRHPYVGDACATAADCGGADWVCAADPAFPGGYCTITGCPTPGSSQGCPGDAICGAVPAAPGAQACNQCMDRCPTVGTADGCRAGYSCVDVGTPNGGACEPVTSQPAAQ